MSTKLVTEWIVPQNEADNNRVKYSFEGTCDALIAEDIQLFLSDKKNNKKGKNLFDLLTSEYQKVSDELKNERWVLLTNMTYFDKKAGGCWLIKRDNTAGFYKKFNTDTDLSEVEQHINSVIKDPINKWKIPSKNKLLMITKLTQAPFPSYRQRPSIATAYLLYSNNKRVQGFDCDSSSLRSNSSGKSLPFLPISKNNVSTQALFIAFLEKGLTPLSLKKSSDYQLLLTIFHRKHKTIFKNLTSISQKFLQQQISGFVTSVLLNEDKIRADISPYHAKILEDTDLGHWSLWRRDDEAPEQETIALANQLVARDPNSSINEGIVGIDFGTKSTVVVYQKNNVNIHPMRIGIGDLSKEVAAFHYENPTIMEFNNLGRFRSDYQAKANKPFTRWQDLTISHTAKNALLGCESSQFNTFLDEIKQWAGDKNRHLKIVGKKG